MIPPAGYMIRHWSDGGTLFRGAGDGAVQLRHRFYVCEGRQPDSELSQFVVHLSPDAHGRAYQHFIGKHGEAAFQESVLIWAVDQIEREVRSGPVGEALIRLDLVAADFPELERRLREKRCSYRVADGRDSFCVVSADPRLGPTRTLAGRIVTWTSPHECQCCSLPDERYLCSQLSHPHVVGTLGSRNPNDARCGKNRPEIQAANLCHAGGHDCWEYAILPSEQDKPAAYLAPALTRNFDALDDAWRLLFRKDHLVVMPSVASIAALERDCVTEQDFNDRVIALGDVLAAFAIPAELLNGSNKKVEGSLTRLEMVLKKQVADDAHRARAIEAVQKLRAANNLRVGAAHGASSARERRLKAQTTLAIQFYPDATWGETWNQLRARVTDALSEITAALRQS